MLEITIMPNATSAALVFEREFLPLRGKLLEVAASLDRIARAGGSPADPRSDQLRRSLEVLCSAQTADRTEQIQMIFSLPYDPNWRT
jgi:hypothetical protein